MSRQPQEKHRITLEELTGGIILDFQGDRYALPDEVAMQLAKGIASILRNRQSKARDAA